MFFFSFFSPFFNYHVTFCYHFFLNIFSFHSINYKTCLLSIFTYFKYSSKIRIHFAIKNWRLHLTKTSLSVTEAEDLDIWYQDTNIASKGVLHPWPQISIFCAPSQNCQYLFENWYMHLIVNCPRNSKIALQFK